ncbi:MAG: DUF58 domain-containing protein [Pseudomonadales bacterium]|nr:DUF58 domain-containing protein [Pseudomonadales bacterium]
MSESAGVRGVNSAAPDSRFWRSRRFQQWLEKRSPPAETVVLNQNNIFILPTREGIYFLILFLCMLLAAINYQNSLIFALAFLLISLFMVSMLHTFRNLSGLQIQGGPSRPVFAGEDAEFRVTVRREGARHYEAIVLGWHDELLVSADLLDAEELTLGVFVPTTARGLLNPGRLLIQTRYPVGLFRAWSWVDLDRRCVVYPRPVPAGEIPEVLASDGEGDSVSARGVDDFHSLREFQKGDAIKHIAWKSFARNETLMVKDFAAHVDRRVWLSWDSLDGMDTENRLSRLCYWALEVARTNDEFGLRLPGSELPPARGSEHLDLVLHELAMYGLSEQVTSSS